MNTEESLQVGVVGAQIELQIVEYNADTKLDAIVDIAGGTGLTITIQRPDLTTLTRTAGLSTDGVDGKMSILTEAGDLTLDGTYYVQSFVTLGVWSGTSSVGQFDVEKNLG